MGIYSKMITNGPYSDYSTISMSDESLFLLELDLTLARGWGLGVILQRLHHCSHRPPSIDPGSGQRRGGTENAKAEACQQENALGKQWWRLAMQHTQHWVGQRGNNRHLSHVAAPQDR